MLRVKFLNDLTLEVHLGCTASSNQLVRIITQCKHHTVIGMKEVGNYCSKTPMVSCIKTVAIRTVSISQREGFFHRFLCRFLSKTVDLTVFDFADSSQQSD